MTLSVSNVPATVDQSQEFQADVGFACPSCTSDSYLRGVFYPSGTSYFGYTEDNSGNWSNAPGGSCTTFFKISQTDFDKQGSWSGKLNFKPDAQSAYYNGPGEYLFKVGRYTSSCSSPLWSTETTIAITGPTPTPTPAPTDTPVPTAKPTPTNTPIPKPTATTTQKPLISPVNNLTATREAVLGESSNSSLFQIPTPKPEKIAAFSAKDSNIMAKILILIGVVFLGACAIVFFYPYILKLINKYRHE